MVQETPSILITTTYQSKADLDFLFQNSSVVLKYLEGGEIDKPIFIALVTPSQKELLQNHKFSVQTIDENTDISRYKLYFTYESNRSDLLKTVGDVFPLSPHHTLLRFPTDASKIYANLQLPRFDIEFFQDPFTGSLPPPKFQTKTITLVPTSQPAQPVQSKKSFPFIFLIVFIAFLAILGLILIKRRRNSEESLREA